MATSEAGAGRVGQRATKETRDHTESSEPPPVVALSVYPGDFERRGLTYGVEGDYEATQTTETQYLIGGARIVWEKAPNTVPMGLDRDARITVAVADLIQSTSAVIDLVSGELLETQTFYPNGAMETHRMQKGVSMASEPMGFTGKEADDEVGVVYFGERYLLPRVGRWASPDPLAIHAMGGGEAHNAYHYVAGNLLAGRDPVGLDDETANALPVSTAPDGVNPGDTFAFQPGEDGRVDFSSSEEFTDFAEGSQIYLYDPDARFSLETSQRVGAEQHRQALQLIDNLTSGLNNEALRATADATNRLNGIESGSGAGRADGVTGGRCSECSADNYKLALASILGGALLVDTVLGLGGLAKGIWQAAKGFAKTVAEKAAYRRMAKETLESAALEARAWQGSPQFPGIDAWTDITLPRGSILVGGTPGPSEYYTLFDSLHEVSFSQRALWEGLEVPPNKVHGFRPGVTVYELTEDTRAAVANTLANPTHGPGGLIQFYVPEFRSVLDPKLSIKLNVP